MAASKLTTTLRIQSPHISCLAVRCNLLYAASVAIIDVFDLSDYAHVDAFNGDSDSGLVKSIAFHDTHIFTAHQDCRIRVWTVSSSKRHRLLSTLPTIGDRLIRFVVPRNHVSVRRHKKRLWIEHCDAVSCLAVNGGLIYSVSWDKSFKIWNAKSFKCMESVTAHEDAVNAVAVSETGTVYTGSADGRIRVWERDGEVRRHVLLATLEAHKSTVNALALNHDGSSLFSGGGDRTIMVWEKGDGGGKVGFAAELVGHGGAVLCLICMEDLMVSGSADRTVRIWRRGWEKSYCCAAVLVGHEKPVKSLVAIRGGGLDGGFFIVSGSLDGEIKIWEAKFKEKKNFRGTGSRILEY